MNGKPWRFVVALLPICCLSAQQPSSPVPPQATHPHQLSPEVAHQIAEQWRRTREHANAINDLAGHIESLEDAHKLVDLIAAEFAKELPPRWATRSIRNRIAQAEYESAADPGSLIPEQHVADVWNDFLEKIGAPQESYVTAAEIHHMRDSSYVGSQLSWAHGNQNIWAVTNIYAIGPDGKVAKGCRAIEALNVLWELANRPGTLQSTRAMMKKGDLLSDDFKNPSQPPAPGTEMSVMSFGIVHLPPNLIEQAAERYMHDHGVRALNRAIEAMLKELFVG